MDTKFDKLRPSEKVQKMSKFDPVFKEEAIRLALTSPQAIAKTARDLKLKESTLYQWVSAAKSNSPTQKDEQGTTINVVEELNRLRKEVKRLKEERDILKKAAVFFAKETE